MSGFANKTLIQGNGFDHRGKIIEVRRYLDLFTFKSEEIDRQLIQPDGSFRFEIDLQDTGLYLIHIEKVNAHLFIEPGSEYTIVVPEAYDADKYNPAKDVFVQLEIFETGTKLNQQITSLEKRINGFIIDHTDKLVGKGFRPLADSFSIVLQDEFKEIEGAFFQEYFHYSLAHFHVITGLSRATIFKRFFENREPAYDQLSFANAFSSLFDEYFDYITPSIDVRFTDSAVAAIKAADYQKLYHVFDVDPNMQSRSYRELLLATQLYELGSEREYKFDNILMLLDELGKSAQDTECKIIVENALSLLTWLAPGTKIPEFEFRDLVGNTFRISEYKGRYIYIQFFDHFTPETLKEMSLMKVLKEGYGSEIAMFSISMSESPERIKQFSDKYDLEWFFGRSVNSDKIIAEYGLRAFPTYFYIDDELNFIKSPAPPPGANIEVLFSKVWNEKYPDRGKLFKFQPPQVDEADAPSAEVPK